ncbi:MAG: 23S rRNA (adenine(2503)-C(2))-methyltransferase RlmN [Pseudomonadota bacterium]|nr:23S rRNA (adenine(2503)-C(2))-methyltransferase RlmN [Pseudomonadota bacterium]
MRTNLVGMTREELVAELIGIGVEKKYAKMRLNQLWKWVYQKGVSNFSSMTDISKEFQNLLGVHFFIGRPQIVKKLVSEDQTRKYLLRLEDNSKVETVFIPDKDRGTLCISSQVGCTLNCSFCFTGTQKLVRNLSVSEIVGQVLVARDDLSEWSFAKNQKMLKRKITNIVMMGMGEPLYNYDSVKDALHIIMDNEGISFSRKRITISTSGVVPSISKVGSEIGCLLAVSFHATTDEIRNQLVPINKKWNISELLNCLRNYPTLSNSQRITFEYVMLRDINDTDDDARRLVKLISGIPAKINLIPFNAWPGSPYRRSSPERIDSFAKIVKRAGYASPVRSPRGEDIFAACGQLKSNSVKKIISTQKNVTERLTT